MIKRHFCFRRSYSTNSLYKYVICIAALSGLMILTLLMQQYLLGGNAVHCGTVHRWQPARKKKKNQRIRRGLWQVAVATKHVTGLSKYRLSSRRCAERKACHTGKATEKKRKKTETFVKILKLCSPLMWQASLNSDDKRDDPRCTFRFTPRESIMNCEKTYWLKQRRKYET